MAKDKTIKLKKKDLIQEHEKLIKVLKSSSHKDDVEEAHHQLKELKAYKRK